MVDIPRTFDAQVRIDWLGDGSFSHGYSDVTDRVLREPGVSVDLGRDRARSFAPPRINAADWTAVNEDAELSPENPSSGVYQLLKPGRADVIDATWGVENLSWNIDLAFDNPLPLNGIGTWPLFRGVLDVPSHDAAFGNRVVRMPSLGTLAALRGRLVTLPLMSSVRTDQAVAAILDAVDWPSDKRAISVGDTTLLYWWAAERDAYEALVELTVSEGASAALYEDGAGVLHWENRNFRIGNERSTHSMATLRDVATTNGLSYTALAYDQGFEQIVNRCTVATRRRQAGTPGTVVWQYGAAFTLAPSQVRVLHARPDDPFTAAIAPVAPTDYAVSDGTVTVALSYTSGLYAVLTVTATSGSPTVTGLQLRATPLVVVSETVIQNSADAADSIAAYGTRALALSAWPEIDPAQAEAIANSMVARYKTPRATLTLSVRNADEWHMGAMLDLRVSDLVAVVNEHLGIASTWFAESLRWRFGGPTAELVLGLEAAAEISGARWEIDEWDDPIAVWGV